MVVVRMPSLTKRPGSDIWYFRRTVPADIKRLLAKMPRAKWPRRWYSDHILISLGTADRAEAKARYAEVCAQVERQIAALRQGPKPLSPKQIAALAGNVYKAFASNLEDDPVLSAQQWRALAEREVGTSLHIDGNTAQSDRRAMEHRFGGMADALLAKYAIVTDDESRSRLIERLSVEVSKAAEKLGRNADGDYTPDAYAKRFPTLEPERNRPHKSLAALAAAWRDAAPKRGAKQKTADRFHGIVLRFGEWLKHDDLERVTRTDVMRWADARLDAGTAASTINKVETAALRAVFEWGVDRGWMEVNPLARNVRIEARRKPKTREKFFSEVEAAVILSAALAVHPTKREDRKTTAAKRWVPLLCAYSGARVTEIIQLRKQDVRTEEGVLVIRLTPDAGGIKTNEFRDVPVHPHLIELGFRSFIEGAPAGHLFCNGSAGAIDGVYTRIRKFVRAIIKDRAVQPSHAWRYTFKTRGAEADIETLVLDAICGHSPGTKGDEYTRITLKTRIAAMKKFPRYALSGSSRTQVAAE